ncbi:MAG: DUF2075 domain-containing protein [Eubacteriales bacterium]
MEKPVIYRISDNKESLEKLENELSERRDSGQAEEASYGKTPDDAKLIFRYPTVYIHSLGDSGKYKVYVGESNNIVQRTMQHYEAAKAKDTWQSRLIGSGRARLYIIGHRHFNKSLTLDVENRLMNYMLGVEKVGAIENRRGNEQDEYYPSEEFDDIFRGIWRGLHRMDKNLFPEQRLIEESAVFKASPFHKLTEEQKRDKEQILLIIQDALTSGRTGQLVVVSGEAGTGKTVLNSNLFYELCTYRREDGSAYNCHLIVNHDQQLKVYQEIAGKLGLRSTDGTELVSKPTAFINRHTGNVLTDVIFVDEAHLLWTQGKQSYRGKNQLEDLRKEARVVVIMFDEHQTLHTQEYWDPVYVQSMMQEAKDQQKKRLMSYYFELRHQLRIRGNEETVRWIRRFTGQMEIGPIPEDKDYDLRIFDDPASLEQAIRDKASHEETKLSRIIATFDWPYTDKKQPEHEDYWYVRIGDWRMPWNLQLPRKAGSRAEQKKLRELPWAEQPVSLGEVGSTFTIQGFDLNYAGVILGPSVTYRDGRIVIDPSQCADKKATQSRTLGDGRKESFGGQFIRDAVNVLMTRGVDGLYIYAVDDELRHALKRAAKHS